jgi:hypothetical protein
MKNENKALGKIIVFSVIFLLVGGIGGYFIGEHSSKSPGNFRGGNGNFSNSNFQLNDSVKSEISSFFNSTRDTAEINTYCQNNPRYCMEYCRTINPSDEICTTLNLSFRGGTPTR